MRAIPTSRLGGSVENGLFPVEHLIEYLMSTRRRTRDSESAGASGAREPDAAAHTLEVLLLGPKRAGKRSLVRWFLNSLGGEGGTGPAVVDRGATDDRSSGTGRQASPIDINPELNQVTQNQTGNTSTPIHLHSRTNADNTSTDSGLDDRPASSLSHCVPVEGIPCRYRFRYVLSR